MSQTKTYRRMRWITDAEGVWRANAGYSITVLNDQSGYVVKVYKPRESEAADTKHAPTLRELRSAISIFADRCQKHFDAGWDQFIKRGDS